MKRLGKLREIMTVFIITTLIFSSTSFYNLFSQGNRAKLNPLSNSNIQSLYTNESYIVWDNSPLTIIGQESETTIDAIQFGVLTDGENPEVIVTLNSTTDYLMVFNGSNGQQLWNVSSQGLVSAFDPSSAIGKREGLLFITDIQGDSQNEIVIPHRSYNASIYGGIKANITTINPITQSIIWNADIWEYGKFWDPLLLTTRGPNDIRAAAIGDTNSDGKYEIVVGTSGTPYVNEAEIFMINGINGSLLWKQNAPNDKTDFLAIADIDNDDQDDVICLSDYTIQTINITNGQPIWNTTLPYKGYSLATGDINGDSCADILVGLSKVIDGSVAVTAINGSDGKSLWNFSTPGDFNPIYDITIADLYNDTNPKIIAGCGGGSGPNYKIYVLNQTGGEIWSKGGSVNTIAIADFDGDNKLDVAYGDYNGKWVSALNGLNGTLIFNKQVTTTNQYFQITTANFSQDSFDKLLVTDSIDKLMMMQENIYPDLTITTSGIAFTPQTPNQGQNVTINCTILNEGNANVTNCKVSIYYDTQNPSNLITNQSVNIDYYAPVYVSAQWNTSGYLGNHNIIVSVDPDDLISESNESNNIAVKLLFISAPTLGPSIQLISPLNTTYNTPTFPINITNSTEVHQAWFRYSINGGADWTTNYTLIFDGSSFVNLTIWTNNHYLLQVYANNSYGKVSRRVASFIVEILKDSYMTDFLITPPNIDGTLNPGEWEKITFNRTVSTKTSHFYLKTNSSHLFLACNESGDSSQTMFDSFSVFVDENHDHNLNGGQEHCFIVYGDDITGYQYWQGAFWISGTPPAGFLGRVNYSTGSAIYEMQIPLNIIPSSTGEVLGISISVYDDDTGDLADWPLNRDPNNASTWGNLNLSGFLSILIPQNVTYNNPTVPIVIENVSSVESVWYRTTTGVGWSVNTTLSWNGSYFTNSSLLLWGAGSYQLQVFCNNSYGDIFQNDEWFTINTTILPSINLLTPENNSYSNGFIPITVSNSSEIATCWYRTSTDGGSNWSNNITLTYNGVNFTNSTILQWSNGVYYLQVFANNSYNIISMREIWFSVSIPINYFVNITAISPNPSNGLTQITVVNSSILTSAGILANVSGPNSFFQYIPMIYQGMSQWIGNITVSFTGLYTVRVNGTNLIGVTQYDTRQLEGDLDPPVLGIDVSQINNLVIITITNSTESINLLEVHISDPDGFFQNIEMVYQGANQWVGNFTPEKDGIYIINANGTDVVGNVGNLTDSFEFTAQSPPNDWVLIVVLGFIIGVVPISLIVIIKRRKKRMKRLSNKNQKRNLT